MAERTSRQFPLPGRIDQIKVEGGTAVIARTRCMHCGRNTEKRRLLHIPSKI